MRFVLGFDENKTCSRRRMACLSFPTAIQHAPLGLAPPLPIPLLLTSHHMPFSPKEAPPLRPPHHPHTRDILQSTQGQNPNGDVFFHSSQKNTMHHRVHHLENLQCYHYYWTATPPAHLHLSSLSALSLQVSFKFESTSSNHRSYIFHFWRLRHLLINTRSRKTKQFCQKLVAQIFATTLWEFRRMWVTKLHSTRPQIWWE